MSIDAATGGTAALGTVPNTAEGLLADRQVVWGRFTRVVLWSTISIAVCLVALVWFVL